MLLVSLPVEGGDGGRAQERERDPAGRAERVAEPVRRPGRIAEDPVQIGARQPDAFRVRDAAVYIIEAEMQRDEQRKHGQNEQAAKQAHSEPQSGDEVDGSQQERNE